MFNKVIVCYFVFLYYGIMYYIYIFNLFLIRLHSFLLGLFLKFELSVTSYELLLKCELIFYFTSFD